MRNIWAAVFVGIIALAAMLLGNQAPQGMTQQELRDGVAALNEKYHCTKPVNEPGLFGCLGYAYDN